MRRWTVVRKEMKARVLLEFGGGKVDYGRLTLAEKQKLIEVEKELILQEQVELSVLMPAPPEMTQLWFNAVVQIGHIAFFSMSFSIAPLWGVVMGVLQCIVMFWSFTGGVRRVVAVESESIGIWEDVIFIYSLLALIINAGILAFSSKGVFTLAGLDALQKGDMYTIVAAIAIAENALFVMKFVISALIPDVPAWVREQKTHQKKLKDYTVDSEIKRQVSEQKRRMLEDSSLLKGFAAERAPAPSEGGIRSMFLDRVEEKRKEKAE